MVFYLCMVVIYDNLFWYFISVWLLSMIMCFGILFLYGCYLWSCVLVFYLCMVVIYDHVLWYFISVWLLSRIMCFGILSLYGCYLWSCVMVFYLCMNVIYNGAILICFVIIMNALLYIFFLSCAIQSYDIS